MPTEKEKEEEIELLKEDKERLSVALNLHKVKIQAPLKKFREYYRGIQWQFEGRANYNDEIVDNIVFGIVQSFVASLYLGNPKISVSANTSTVTINGKQADATLGAVRHQLLSSFLYEQLDVNATMELITVDAFLGNMGIAFTGFEAKTKNIKESVKDDSNEGDGLFGEILESESLFVDRISPRDFITEVDARDPNLKDHKRIYIRWVKTPSEVKEEYNKDITPNGKIENKEDQHQFATFNRGDSEAPKKDVWARVEGYTIWDRENQEIRVIVQDHDEYLEKKKWPLDYKGEFPVDILWFNYAPDSSIPIADTGLYIGMQDYINMIHSKIIDHVRKLADRKYVYQKDIKSNDFENWAKGPSGSGLKVKNPNNAIEAVNDGGVSQDFYREVSNTKADVSGMLGISQFETGGNPNFKSATEGKLEAQGILPKRAFRSAKYKKFITRVIAKLGNVASQVLPSTEIPLSENSFDDFTKNRPELLNGRDTGETNDKGQKIVEVFPFTTIDKELLSGSYTYKVDIVDAGPESESKRRQDAALLLKMSETMPMINKEEALKVFFDAFGFSHLKDRLLKDRETVKQEQVAAMQAQVEVQKAIGEPKVTADIEKTKMKSMVSLITKGMDADQKENEGRRRFIVEQGKISSKEGISSMDRLFELARSGNGKGE